MSRTPLDPAAVRLVAPWTQLRVVDETTSTNADLLAPGTSAGSVLCAEFQSGGRGRLDRSWTSPPRAGLTVSMRLEPPAPTSQWSWLPLLVGLAVRDTVLAAGAPARLKWPNDVLTDGRKLAGILVQASGPAVVVGIGLNVDQTADELPVPGATSLALAGAHELDRTVLLASLLDRLGDRYLAWTSGAGVREEYAAACDSLGAALTVTLADGRRIEGAGSGIGPAGQLLVDSAGETVEVAAGDVVHASVG